MLLVSLCACKGAKVTRQPAAEPVGSRAHLKGAQIGSDHHITSRLAIINAYAEVFAAKACGPLPLKKQTTYVFEA